MLKQKEEGRQTRIETVIKQGYPAYTTSVGWMGELALTYLLAGLCTDQVSRLPQVTTMPR
jgi:hypothetical protein